MTVVPVNLKRPRPVTELLFVMLAPVVRPLADWEYGPLFCHVVPALMATCPLFDTDPLFVTPLSKRMRQSLKSRALPLRLVDPENVITPLFTTVSLRFAWPATSNVPLLSIDPPVFWFRPPPRTTAPAFSKRAPLLNCADIVQVAPARLMSEAKPLVLKFDGNAATPKLSKTKVPETAVAGMVAVPRLNSEPLALFM